MSQEAARAINTLLTIRMGEVLAQASESITGQVGKQVSVFAAAFQSSARRSRGNRIQAIHTMAAREAQSAILTAYTSRNRRNPAQPYRDTAPGKWKRDSNGAMNRALNSPEFFKATGTQLAFVNKNVMDRSARQWYRLNFGAGPAAAATPRPGAFPMQILGRKTGLSLNLAGNGPSGAYSMPAGFFNNGGQFTPLGYVREAGLTVTNRTAKRSFTKKRMSIGFPGYMFLDAGVRVLSASLGRGYTNLSNEWFNEAISSNTGPVAFVIRPSAAAKILGL